MSEAVLYERRGAVAWIVLNRPEARNALNAAVREGLWEQFTRFRDEEDAVVAVLAGNGPVFCAGGDLKEMAETGLQKPMSDAIPYRSAELGWREALDEGDRIFEPVYLSEDAQEGPRAFLEKRDPVWKAR